jgi:hypothetical protein
MLKATTAMMALVLGLPFATAGCKGDDDKAKSAGGSAGNVTAKTAPANPGDAPQPASGPPAGSTLPATPAAPGSRESVDGVSYELPPGWSQNRDNPVRLVTITDGQVEIAVNAFPGNVGGTLLNVNRWRGQVGLPPVASEEEAKKDIREVDVNGTKVEVVDLSGATSRTLVATVPGKGKLYFFKMTAPTDVAAKHKDAFERFVQTIRVE